MRIEKIDSLEGLRGLCALSVLISHLSHDSTGIRTAGATYFPGYVPEFFSVFGNIGVLLFFVLSGFVIGYAHRSDYSFPEAKKYLIKRFIRLYPIYLIIVVFSFSISDANWSVWQFVGHLLYLETWLVPVIDTNGVLWTLHLEVCFYLLFLLAWRFNLDNRKVIVFCLIAALLSPFLELHVLRVLGYFYLWMLGLYLARKVEGKAIRPTGSSRIFWSSILLSVGYTIVNLLEITVAKHQVKEYGQLSTLSVVVISGLLYSTLASLTGGFSKTIFYSSKAICLIVVVATLVFSFSKGLIYQQTGYQLLFGFFVLYCLSELNFFPDPENPLKMLSWLGGISYGIYMVQNPLAHIVFALVPAEAPVYMWWLVCGAVFLLVFLIAWILEIKYQSICSAWLRKKLYS